MYRALFDDLFPQEIKNCTSGYALAGPWSRGEGVWLRKVLKKGEHIGAGDLQPTHSVVNWLKVGTQILG